MNENELLAYLEKAAYNRPEVIPAEITQNDAFHYRVYFRFMAAVYALYRSKVYTKEQLTDIKASFIKDWNSFAVISKANIKTIREMQKFETALYDCRKNSESCECCSRISCIIGAETQQNEPDIQKLEVNE